MGRSGAVEAVELDECVNVEDISALGSVVDAAEVGPADAVETLGASVTVSAVSDTLSGGADVELLDGIPPDVSVLEGPALS